MYLSVFAKNDNKKSKKPMSVLVVGGAGYIGGATTDVLMERGITFTVYDKLLYDSHFLKSVDFVHGDIRDTTKLKELLPQYTHVVWLAALVGDPACRIKPELTKEVNQDAVEWFAKNYDGRIIFLSTCSVYGINNDEVDEDTPLNPLSEYAETKAEAEKFLKGKNALIFRLGTVFGVADDFSRVRMDLAVNYMTANALQKGSLSVFGGSQWRPFIHVKDIGRVIVDNLDNDTTGIYNLAQQNKQIKDLGEAIAQMTGAEIEYTEIKFQDQRNYHASTKKGVRDKLFDPKTMYTIEDGVKEIKDLMETGRLNHTENDVYFNERHLLNLLEHGRLN
jgi:nucleoside-diphosphate-sugar epimerase